MKTIWIELYTAGLSTRQIAERTGASKSAVALAIQRAGISRGRSISQIYGCRRVVSVRFDWSFFPINPDKAWLLGLIFGDGSLQKDGYRITITTAENDIVDNVNNLFDRRLSIDQRQSYAVMHINSVCLWLELYTSVSLMPNKSRSLTYPLLDDVMQPHFARGLLDSDGCWSWDRRSTRQRLRFSYSSLSRPFVEVFRQVLIDHVGVSSRRHISMTKNGAAWLAFTNEDAISIGSWLYPHSSETNRCQRKYALWYGCL